MIILILYTRILRHGALFTTFFVVNNAKSSWYMLLHVEKPSWSREEHEQIKCTISTFTECVSYLNISGKVLLICWNYYTIILTCWNYYTTTEDQCNVRSVLYVVNNIGTESMSVTIKKLIEDRLWVVHKLHIRSLGTNFTW